MKVLKRLVVTDFDGTIVASDGIWNEVYLQFCALKKTQSLESVAELLGRIPFEDWILSIRNVHCASDSYHAVLSGMNDLATSLYCRQRPNEGFVDFLETHPDYRIIVVSRESPRLIDTYLRHWGIIDIVHSISQDEDNGRLNIRFFKRCAADFGCDVSDVVYIDDSLAHCVAAKASGAFVVGYNDGHTLVRQKQMRSICDKYVNNFNEICDL